jgi:hypothetical protein
VADSNEDRARWFKALSRSVYLNKVESMSFLNSERGGTENEPEKDNSDE